MAVSYIVDAGPLIGWFNRRDQWHDWSVAALRAADDVLWTSEVAFAEACHQLGGNTPEVSALLVLAAGGNLQVLATIAPYAQRLGELLAKYPQMDVGDGSIVVLSEQHPRAKVVTLDTRDFLVYRRFRSEALPLIYPN